VSVFTIVKIVNLHEMNSSFLPGVIAHAAASNTFSGLIPANQETVPVPSTPLPTVDAAINSDATPAWDPNSLTPRTRPEYDGTVVWRHTIDFLFLHPCLRYQIFPGIGSRHRRWLESRSKSTSWSCTRHLLMPNFGNMMGRWHPLWAKLSTVIHQQSASS
jgi:hypothetical protein